MTKDVIKDSDPNLTPKSVHIKLASPEEILSWSHGEVTKPETINYRVGRPEKGGLFCEKIFGPIKDYQCYCGKYKGIRYKGVVCDRCGVEITKSSVRRERMGHIKLAAPVAHIWFLRKSPSRIGLVLGVSGKRLEQVIYFTAHIITKVNKKIKAEIIEQIEAEYKKKKAEKEVNLEELKNARKKAHQELSSIKKLRVISEREYRGLALRYGSAFEAKTGGKALQEILSDFDIEKKIKTLKERLKNTSSVLQQEKAAKRIRLLEGMLKARISPDWMLLTVLPVLPPELRPMVQLDGGRYASSDINDLYRRVINRNNRLKRLSVIKAPEIIIRNEKRMLQESVDALIDNQMRSSNAARGRGRRPLRSLADSIQGKTGRFRRNLLGKRVDYSARSVIAIGIDLKMSECGLPKKMALELFKPFVIKHILDQELAYNIKGASRLIEQGTPEIWAILEKVVQGKFVLLNRAPTLHRLGIQAFRPLLIEGNAIRVHPLVCAAFNADFDGDQMAVHLPLSRQAQEESKNIMLSGVNLRKPATGLPVATPSQDIILGIYFLTTVANSLADEKVKYFTDTEEALLCYQNEGIGVRTIARVNIKPNLASKPELLRTTVGRILFNQILPKNYPFFNKLVDKKTLVRIATDIIEKNSLEESQVFLDQMKKIGFQYSSLSGASLGIDDFVIPREKGKLVDAAKKKVLAINKMGDRGLFSKREERSQIVNVWQEVISTLKKSIPQELPKDGALSVMVTSGARGSWDQPFQMCGMKGLVANPAGRIIELPVINSFKEGLDVLGYFISTHGARKGMADKALRTSSAGYLTRRLVDVAHDVLIREEDCGDTEGLTVFYQDAEILEQDFAFKIVGRYVLNDVIDPETKNKIAKKGKLIDWDQARQIENLKIKKIKIRSPLTCKTAGGICQKCYGWDTGVNKLTEVGQAVGIIAAQSIGEPGTQLTMRTFHLGGVAGVGDITQGLPRVEELFENRIPKIQALTASRDGIVREVDLKERAVRIEASGNKVKRTIREYHAPESLSILVKAGDKVKKGQRLSEGVIRPDYVFKYFGERAAQNYIVQEVQKVYAGEGVKIHDKHLEVIARQMFSRVKVVDGGDSFWNTDEIITRYQLDQKNKELSEQKKAKVVAMPVLLGVSRVALSSESFLSAASFQETSQILIRAALRNQEDKLRGLKENVIIGKLIPAGTGRKEK